MPGTSDALKIVHVISSLAIGGMERVVLSLAKTMVRQGHTVSIACTEKLGDQAEEAVQSGIDVVDIAFTRSWDNLAPGRLVDLIRSRKADIIHSHTGVWFAAATAARCARVGRSVHTEHGSISGTPVHGRMMASVASRLTDRIIVVSQPIKVELAALCCVPTERITQISNGIDTDLYRRDEVQRGIVRSELDIDDNTVVVGAIGRHEYLKGMDILLKGAWHINPPENALLLYIGDGPETERLKRDAAGCPVRIRFLGPRYDVARLLQAIDIVVLPSRSEGLPLAALEAMAAERYVIAAAVGELPHLLRQGVGMLVPPEDPLALADAISEGIAIGIRRFDAGLGARSRVISEYSIESMVREYMLMYRNVGIQRR